MNSIHELQDELEMNLIHFEFCQKFLRLLLQIRIKEKITIFTYKSFCFLYCTYKTLSKFTLLKFNL
jgi:hypothetical protein